MVEGLSIIVKKQEEKINKLIEEKNESNNKIKKLENESNNKIKKLEEEFNKKIKQFEDKSNNKIKQFEDKSNNKIKQIEIKDINNLLKIFKGSRVLSNNDEEIMISNWIKPNSKIKVNLLYQISRDGDNISTFYNKVKNKYPTLILIKSKSGYKFGGYTTQTWEITNIYKKDELSFPFSLNKQKKYNIKKIIFNMQFMEIDIILLLVVVLIYIFMINVHQIIIVFAILILIIQQKNMN